MKGCIASGISIAGFFIRGCIVFILLLLILFVFVCYRAGKLRGLMMLTFGDCAFRHFPKNFSSSVKGHTDQRWNGRGGGSSTRWLRVSLVPSIIAFGIGPSRTGIFRRSRSTFHSRHGQS
jgi:hypothetical protein